MTALWIGFGGGHQRTPRPFCVVAWCFDTAVEDRKFTHAAGGSDDSFVPGKFAAFTACGHVAKRARIYTTCQYTHKGCTGQNEAHIRFFCLVGFSKPPIIGAWVNPCPYGNEPEPLTPFFFGTNIYEHPFATCCGVHEATKFLIHTHVEISSFKPLLGPQGIGFMEKTHHLAVTWR